MQASSSTETTTTLDAAPGRDEELTEVITHDLFAFVNKLLTAGHRELFTAMEKEDLSITQVKSLHALVATADGPMALGGGLRSAGPLDGPRSSRSVDGLVQRGLVQARGGPARPPLQARHRHEPRAPPRGASRR